MISFPETKVYRTEIFARLPERYRRKGQHSEWGNANRAGAVLECFLESPAFDRSGNLYVVDVPFGRIFRVSPAGVFDLVCEYDGWPYGLKIHQDGRIFIADYRLGILLLDPASGKITPLVSRYLPVSLKGANDLCFSKTGDLYFTDYGQTDLRDPTGRVFRLTAGGKLECLLDFIPGPNGLTLNPAGNVLYIAATRANAVWRASIMPDGSFVKASVFVHLSGGVGPDGMTVDAEGNIVVAHAGRGIVWVYSTHGDVLCRIESCGSYELSNVAYGGPDLKTLFITDAEGEILTTRLPVAGHPLFSHQ
jgi:gluconolactonase